MAAQPCPDPAQSDDPVDAHPDQPNGPEVPHGPDVPDGPAAPAAAGDPDDPRAMIQRATGVVMSRYRIDAADATVLLKQWALTRHITLAEMASAVVGGVRGAGAGGGIEARPHTPVAGGIPRQRRGV